MMRWLIRLIGTLMVFVVLAVGALFLMPVDRIANIAADQIRSATGREVVIGGDVSLSLWPTLGASLGSLSVANAAWSQQGPMLEAKDVSVGIDAAALLSGTVKIKHISAASPVVRLQTRADGSASWDFSTGDAAPAATDSSSSGLPAGFSLDQFEVSDATFIYEAEGAAPISYTGTDLSLKLPDPAGQLSFEAVVHPASSPVSITGTVDTIAEFLEGEVRGVEVTASTSSSTVSLKGRAGVSGDIAGRLSVKTSSTDDLMASFGLAGLDLPAGLGRALSLDTDMTFTGGTQIALRGLSADLGEGNTIAGDVDVVLSDVPQVTANLQTGAFDVSMLTADDGSTEAAGSGWSTDPIDASGLAAFNGDIALSAGSLDLGMMTLGATRMAIRNDRSRMVVDLSEVQAYDGTIAGEFVMNNRSGLSVGGNLTMANLQVDGLLRDFAEISDISGLATSNISFLGVGQSLDQIMRSLRGQGAMSLAKGRIQGFNLDQLMRTGKLQGGTTVFNELKATFTLDQGNMINTDLFATLEDFEASGEGRIGLGAQDIEYLFTPKALRINKSQGGLAIPVSLSGPWSDVKIRPDLKAALDLNLDAEKERLERKLKEEAAQKEQELKDKLDREKEEVEARLKAREAELKQKLQAEAAQKLKLQSGEDDLKKQLEEKAGSALRKLFD